MVDIGGVDRLHERVGVGEGGQQHAHRPGRDLAAAGEQLGARHPRHALVADDEGHGLGGQEPQGLLGALRAQDGVVHGEQGLEGVQHPHLVIHDQDRRLIGHDRAALAMGMRTVKTAPPPAGLSARISPPCFLTIS